MKTINGESWLSLLLLSLVEFVIIIAIPIIIHTPKYLSTTMLVCYLIVGNNICQWYVCNDHNLYLQLLTITHKKGDNLLASLILVWEQKIEILKHKDKKKSQLKYSYTKRACKWAITVIELQCFKHTPSSANTFWCPFRS